MSGGWAKDRGPNLMIKLAQELASALAAGEMTTNAKMKVTIMLALTYCNSGNKKERDVLASQHPVPTSHPPMKWHCMKVR